MLGKRPPPLPRPRHQPMAAKPPRGTIRPPSRRIPRQRCRSAGPSRRNPRQQRRNAGSSRRNPRQQRRNTSPCRRNPRQRCRSRPPSRRNPGPRAKSQTPPTTQRIPLTQTTHPPATPLKHQKPGCGQKRPSPTFTRPANSALTGYSPILNLYLRWENGQLKWLAPQTGQPIPTFADERQSP